MIKINNKIKYIKTMKNNNNHYSFNLNATSYVPKNKAQYNQQQDNNVSSKIHKYNYFA